MTNQYIIPSAFTSVFDEFDGSGKRPVVFDIIGPDRVRSMLPPDLKMVLHVNPSSMGFTYAKNIARQQTKGGWVEYHWGSNPTEIAFNMATGGFVRLYSGLSNITGPTASNNLVQPASMQALDVGGTRRDTIAYDKFLDMLALFHNNGAIEDVHGNIAFQGQILITYDGGSWWGWFTTFTVEETAEKPYQFALTANFTVDREVHRTKSVYIPRDMTRGPTSPAPSPPAPPPARGSEDWLDDTLANVSAGDADVAIPAPVQRGHTSRSGASAPTGANPVVPPTSGGG